MSPPDHLTPARRSDNMARIRSKDTLPEIWIRSALHKRGFRFRLHVRSLPGCPDIVLPKYRTAILVHGCFWHMHRCKEGRIPKSNIKFWKDKLEGNRRRDKRNTRRLNALGYRVITIWSCAIERDLEKVVRRVTRYL